AAQQNPALPHGHAADHQAGIFVVHGAASHAHGAQPLIIRRDPKLHRLPANGTELQHSLYGRLLVDSGIVPVCGLVAELVDAVDSKSTGLAHLGSTPSEATTITVTVPAQSLRELQRSDFDYHLPSELIAQTPLPVRSASRLLLLDGHVWRDAAFGELPQMLASG